MLAVKASSVLCERIFSSSKESTTLRRNSVISPAMMEHLQMLKFVVRQNRIIFMQPYVATEEDLRCAEVSPELVDQLLREVSGWEISTSRTLSTTTNYIRIVQSVPSSLLLLGPDRNDRNIHMFNRAEIRGTGRVGKGRDPTGFEPALRRNASTLR